MERDLTDFDPNYVFEMDEFYSNVKKIMNLNFFNRIKQFMIRLYRNNLFLGNKSKNGQKNGITTCFACNNHPENRSRSNKILQFLVRVLKKARILNKRCQIDMFIFKTYPINSIENIALRFTSEHIYNSKFSNKTLLCVPYAYALKRLVSDITLTGLPLNIN